MLACFSVGDSVMHTGMHVKSFLCVSVVTEDEINKALEEGEDLDPPEGCEPHVFRPYTNRNNRSSNSINANSNSNNSSNTVINCNSSVDPSSDDADDKDEEEEEEDSGVEVPANPLQPEPSEGGPSFAVSGAELHRERLQKQQDSVKLSWEETK